jgi:hypothetical protein
MYPSGSTVVVRIDDGDHRFFVSDAGLGFQVSEMNHIAKLDPPRSWPKQHKARFETMPYDMQVYVAGHEARREKEIRRAHNEAATARRKLTQQPSEVIEHGANETTAA